MKVINFLLVALVSVSCASKSIPPTGRLDRVPASVETKRLLEIDERRGCCSHHGGVSHCSAGSLYCNDGWISGCGC